MKRVVNFLAFSRGNLSRHVDLKEGLEVLHSIFFALISIGTRFDPPWPIEVTMLSLMLMQR